MNCWNFLVTVTIWLAHWALSALLWGYNCITFSFPFLYLNTSMYSSLLSFKVMTSVFHYLFLHAYMFKYTLTYIPKYINETCSARIVSYIFRDDHLVLDTQLVCCSLGKTTSPALHIPYLAGILCVHFEFLGTSWDTERQGEKKIASAFVKLCTVFSVPNLHLCVVEIRHRKGRLNETMYI